MSFNNSINSVPNVQIFTGTGINTWTKPTGAKVVYVVCVGAGGGGGGGAKNNAGTNRLGGAGGGGGAISTRTYLASLLNSTESVYVGAGGTGGAGSTTTNTVGISGNTGESSSFSTGLTQTIAYGGGGGSGASLFVTHAPCLDCAKLVYQSGINSVFYRNAYRSQDGLNFLEKAGVKVEKI